MNDANHSADSIASPQSSIESPLHVPPLSIRHLLGWMAVAAGVLGWMSVGQWHDGPGHVSAGRMLFSSLLGIGLSWLLFGSLLIGSHAVRRTLWTLEPGEWLVLALTNMFFMRLAIDPVDRFFTQAMSFFDWGWWHTLMSFAAHVVRGEIGVVFLWGAFALRRQPLWSALFALAAMQWLIFYLPLSVFAMIHGLFLSLPGLIVMSTLFLGLLIAAEIHDFWRRFPRHWLHWSGVILSLVFILGRLATQGIWALHVLLGNQWP